MTNMVEAPLDRARLAIGAPFRMHGRDPKRGLDCVGLVAFAYQLPAPTGYALRCSQQDVVHREVAAAGLERAVKPQAGDLLLLRPGAGMLHLAIDSGDGIIHADAMLRRVVALPAPITWPELARWRRSGE